MASLDCLQLRTALASHITVHFYSFEWHGIAQTVFLILIFLASMYSRFAVSSWGVLPQRDYIRRRGTKRRSMKTFSDKEDSAQWVKKPARTLIDRPDAHLDSLIAAGSIDEARKYRISMEKISKEMLDEHSLRNYRIYEEVIEDKQKELDAKHQPVPSSATAPVKTPRIAPKPTVPAVPTEKAPLQESQAEETQTSVNPSDYTELIDL